jgi:hypothetical protein
MKKIVLVAGGSIINVSSGRRVLLYPVIPFMLR